MSNEIMQQAAQEYVHSAKVKRAKHDKAVQDKKDANGGMILGGIMLVVGLMGQWTWVWGIGLFFLVVGYFSGLSASARGWWHRE